VRTAALGLMATLGLAACGEDSATPEAASRPDASIVRSLPDPFDPGARQPPGTYFGARRSETISGLGGPGRDERWERIDIHATALAGIVIITVIIGAWLVEVAQGHDGSPYTQLGAIGGLAYVLAVALLRWRS
jgi:hypothetical protein